MDNRLFEIVQVQPCLGVETPPHALEAVILDVEFAGAVDPRREQVTADAGVVAAAGRNVDVKVRLPVLAREVAREAGDLHLLGEGLVHILFGGGVQEAERGLRDGGDAADDAAADVLLLAEGGEGRRDFGVVVHAQQITAVRCCLRLIHDVQRLQLNFLCPESRSVNLASGLPEGADGVAEAFYHGAGVAADGHVIHAAAFPGRIFHFQ